jgi:hypothetical protein
MTTTAQTWTLLGIVGTMAAGILAMVGLSHQSLRSYLDAKFQAVEARFLAAEVRFDGVDRRLDNLDRDVQTLFRDRY